MEKVRSAALALGRVVVSNTDPMPSVAEGTGLVTKSRRRERSND